MQSLFKLPASAFIGLVVFTGDAEFKSDLGPEGIGSLVWRLQHRASAPRAGLYHAWGMVSLARIVWGQDGRVAMEVERGVRGVQPSVRPFDPDGSQGLTPGWTPEPRSSVMVKTQSSDSKQNK